MYNRSTENSIDTFFNDEISNLNEIPNLVDQIIEEKHNNNQIVDFAQIRTEITGKPIPSIETDLMRKTRELIQKSDKARQSRGIWGGLSIGSERFHQLNIAWAGIDHGIHLIGGEASIGKSSVTRMIAYDIIRNNPKVHVRFYTLDDAEDYFLSCFVAQAASVPINAVDKPDSYIHKPEGYFKQADYKLQVKRGHEMYNRFLSGEFNKQFSFVGTATLASSDWNVIEDDIRRTKSDLPEDMELVVCIDNFHDIEIPEFTADTNRKTEEIANRSGKLCESLQIAMIGTVELKKNSMYRPVLDDIFGSRKWKYRARSILLLYSEVAMKVNPRIYYERIDQPGIPASVLEIHLAKNKGNNFKGRLFYHQLTDSGTMYECPIDQAKHYVSCLS